MDSSRCLPEYLNELRLLVIPSYSEDLPNIIPGAMACGTTVLITAIAAIPNVIKDNENGFIMGDNSPDFIARNAVCALNCPLLEQITWNAYNLVMKEYNLQTAVNSYKNSVATLK